MPDSLSNALNETTERQAGTSDVIGGFPIVSDHCAGCSKLLLIENAWMTDGCPCNSPLGVNSMNEMRWRLLMSLQQKQSAECERLSEIVGQRGVEPVRIAVPQVEYIELGRPGDA